MAELGLLTASLLHELRQPLFCIRARVQLRRAKNEGLNAEDQEALLEHLSHVGELLDHYAGFSRLDGAVERFDLNLVAGQSAAMLAHRGRQDGSVFQLDLHPEPLHVVGRRTALRQVVLNLVQNALDAVSGQLVREVEVLTERCGGDVVLRVRDSGPGVREVDRQRVFEPFFTTKDEGKGTGLGLFITRRLVRDMGGEVTLEACEGGGASVVLRIPAAPELSAPTTVRTT